MSTEASTPVGSASVTDAPDAATNAPGSTTALDGVSAYSVEQLRAVRELLARLSAMRRLARFYPIDHPAAEESVRALMSEIDSYHTDGIDVQLAFYGGEILFGEQVLTEESVIFDQLVRDVEAAGIGTLLFRRGLDIDELIRAVPLLAADSVDVREAGGLSAIVESVDTPHIFAGEVLAVEEETEEADVEEEPKGSRNNAVSLLQEIERLIQSNRTIGQTKVKGVARSLVDNVLSNPQAMLQLTGLKSFDEYTFYHSANVAILSIALASRITSDYRFLTSLGVGALMHDVGKLAVDPEILNKPGALTPEEWARVREHPVRGAESAATIPGVDRSAIVAILEHHMRYDLTGYPRRRTERPQHLASRIVAIADAYDAMTSRRAYSAARVQDEAVALIAEGAGSSLDPTLVRLFIRLIGVYPPRSVVRLTNGEVGIVLHPGLTDPLRPTVRIISDPAGVIGEPRDLDLSTVENVSIAQCIDERTLNVEVEDYL